jgi:uncharacterized membrane protein
VIGLAAASEKLRARDERSAVGRGALALSAASVAVLAVTGWLGGELAFRGFSAVRRDQDRRRTRRRLAPS